MNKKKMPVEISGYVNRFIWSFDRVRDSAGYRMMSLANDHHDEDEFEPWNGDFMVDDCPF